MLYLGNNPIAGLVKPLAGRNVGEIVASSLPLTDAGLHLLDGSLIPGGGIYQGFVDYIAELYGDGTNIPSYFCTESAWQTSVSTYGVCGKFVYDSVNNTVRLPKVTGIIEGTTDASALGDLVEAGLPNIIGYGTSHNGSLANMGGAFETTSTSSSVGANTGSGFTYGFKFDASLSNPIYGNSSTVQPQTIKAFYYIVIANSTKTEIEIDIDQVTTDLNGKMDIDYSNAAYMPTKTDLSNCTKPYVTTTYTNGSTHYRIYSDGWCEQAFHATAPATINSAVYLPIPFKDANYTVVGGVADIGDLYMATLSCYPYSGDRFGCLCSYSGAGYAYACNFYACGYVS